MRTLRFGWSIMTALALAAAGPVIARAQQHDMHGPQASDQERTPEQEKQFNALVRIVRESTERFRDAAVAQSEGYALQFGCVSGPDVGAMGLHFVKGDLIGDDVLDPTQPEIVIYEPMPDGRLKLIGADFLVLKSVWDAKHAAPPQIMGQLMHLFDAPNRFGLPPFYTLHVWAWKNNPSGTFVNWHPNVSCDAFTGGDTGVPPDPGPDGLRVIIKDALQTKAKMAVATMPARQAMAIPRRTTPQVK
jgi:hypothetical protein